MNLASVKKDLKAKASPARAKILQKFFKTGPGQYGEGDIFIGIDAPTLRTISQKYQDLDFSVLSSLLKSKIHEERALALSILVIQYQRSQKQKDQKNQKKIFDFYFRYRQHINNWDLVDMSCRDIMGAYLFDKDRKILYKLARSQSLWERRLAIMATFYFLRERDFKDTLKISEMLLRDREDLIHKASGWMLREMGKREEKPLLRFLDKFANQMPRTMLRYSIEKLSPAQKAKYMSAGKAPRKTI